MTKIVHPDETLNIYYRVSEDTEELEDIVKIERNDDKKEISDLPDLQNTKIIQWSPDSEHEDEEFEFDIDGFGTQKVKVTDIPEIGIDNFEENKSVSGSTEPFGLYKEDENIYNYYTVQKQGESMNRTTSESFIGDYSVYSDDGSGDIDYSPHGGDTLACYPKNGSTFHIHVYDNTDDGESGPNLGFLLDEDGNGLGWRARNTSQGGADARSDFGIWENGEDWTEIERKEGINPWPTNEWVRIRFNIISETELNIQYIIMDGHETDEVINDLTYEHDADIDWSKHGFGFGSDQSGNTPNIYFDAFDVEKGPVHIP